MEKLTLNVKAISKKDFNSICRLCLRQGTLANIFNLKYERTLFLEILSELLSTQLKAEDELPKNICEICVSEILRFYDFRKVFFDSEKILQSIITEELNKSTSEPVLLKEYIVIVNNTTLNGDLIEDLIEIKDHPIIKEDENNIVTTDTIDDIFTQRADRKELQDYCILETVKSDSEIEHTVNDNLKDLVNTVTSDDHLSQDSIEISENPYESNDQKLKPNDRIPNLSPSHEDQIQFGGITTNNLVTIDNPVLCTDDNKKLQETVNDDFGPGHDGNSAKKKLTRRKELQKKVFTCSCQKSFTVRSEYIDHREKEKHLNLRDHSCQICNKKFTKSNYLRRHNMRNHIKEKPYECEISYIHTEDNKKLQETVNGDFGAGHVASSAKKKFCQKTLTVKHDVKSKYIDYREKEKHLNPRNHSCEVCNKIFTYRSKLKRHMRKHTKEKPYECEICSMRFSFNCSRKRHMMKHTGETPYVCEFCGKGFIQAGSLKDHRASHTGLTGEKPLCSYCGKRLSGNTAYKLHLQKHLNCKDTKNAKPQSQGSHQCKLCQKIFTTKTSLRAHVLCHGEKKFLCSNCGKSYYTKSALQTHSNVHAEGKPFSCVACDKIFPHRVSLKLHILTHAGDKPYKCNICLKSFGQQHHLKTHLKTHTGEKPYACPHCNRSFTLSWNLRVHIRTHTGETPYMCDLCPRGFYDSNGLKRHRKRHLEGSKVKKKEVEI